MDAHLNSSPAILLADGSVRDPPNRPWAGPAPRCTWRPAGSRSASPRTPSPPSVGAPSGPDRPGGRGRIAGRGAPHLPAAAYARFVAPATSTGPRHLWRHYPRARRNVPKIRQISRAMLDGRNPALRKDRAVTFDYRALDILTDEHAPRTRPRTPLRRPPVAPIAEEVRTPSFRWAADERNGG